jgi:hypothetical protein
VVSPALPHGTIRPDSISGRRSAGTRRTTDGRPPSATDGEGDGGRSDSRAMLAATRLCLAEPGLAEPDVLGGNRAVMQDPRLGNIGA